MDPEALLSRRIQYETDGFDVTDADPDPLAQFHDWFDAVAELLVEPHAMVVATVDGDRMPTARTVLLRGLDDRGLVFFTNYTSAKGRAILANPVAEAVFSWLEVHRQVRVRGDVLKLNDDESDSYFQTRPRGSQIGAWASPQSQVVASREALDALVADVEARFADGDVPRPPHWGGYRIIPRQWEFWQGRPSRLHDRIRYRRPERGEDSVKRWIIERLAP